MKYDIDYQTANETFYLDKEKYELFWKKRPLSHFVDERTWKGWNAQFAGKKSGSLDKHDYVVISFLKFGEKRRILRAHRIIWTLVYGKPPEYGIDHENGIPWDNRISNLRCVTQHENCLNSAKSKANKSGYKGVSWSSQKGKWRARITLNGIDNHIGFFDDVDAAGKAVSVSYRKLGFHENNGREKVGRND